MVINNLLIQFILQINISLKFLILITLAFILMGLWLEVVVQLNIILEQREIWRSRMVGESCKSPGGRGGQVDRDARGSERWEEGAGGKGKKFPKSLFSVQCFPL